MDRTPSCTLSRCIGNDGLIKKQNAVIDDAKKNQQEPRQNKRKLNHRSAILPIKKPHHCNTALI
jgi:hypothetical protein